MTTNPKYRMPALALATAALAAAATIGAAASSPKFFTDDPVWVERATQDASKIEPSEVKLFVDLTYNIVNGGQVITPGPAKNVNSIDEVPDSSWFTNRIGHLPLTADEVANGPNSSTGPAPGAWTVTSSKSDGVTPGFTIKDSTGQRWFLKFDPPGFRGMATGTEVAVTKLLWALGYNVPENRVAYVRREQLVVGADASFTPEGGKRRGLRADDLDRLLKHADREANGSYRVVASKALAGTPVGRIRFSGVRPDDPNDLVAHQDRRELRGYGVFAAWLNHVDAKAINSLDTLVREDGRSYVRHHLIDFGSSLGSGGVGPADYSAGQEYLVEPRRVARQMLGFGFYTPKWHTAEYYEAPSIGRLPKENADFDPEQWRPRVPNQAFLHARAEDKFWAARKLMALTTDMLRAAVRSGEFGDPKSEEFLVHALAQRRDAIGRRYLAAVNPIVDPMLDVDGRLTFDNAAVDADVARAPQGYRAVWSTFDNATGVAVWLGESSSRSTSIAAPRALPAAEGTFVQVAVSAAGASNPAWEAPVDAYFRLRNGAWQLVGFERIAGEE
jgi:hypothetical protein